MINYNNSKIYKIEPIIEHEEGEIYIGSTTKKYLCQRMATHRGYYKMWKESKMNKVMSFILFDKYGIDNCKIILIENFNAKTKDELLLRESHYIKTINCINKCIPLQTWKEYYEINKEKIKETANKYYETNRTDVLLKVKLYSEENKDKIKNYKKEYREKNKEQIYNKQKSVITCDCGCNYTLQNKKRHLEGKKHLKYLNNCNE